MKIKYMHIFQFLPHPVKSTDSGEGIGYVLSLQ
jgi:hypothetical protein